MEVSRVRPPHLPAVEESRCSEASRSLFAPARTSGKASNDAPKFYEQSLATDGQTRSKLFCSGFAADSWLLNFLGNVLPGIGPR